MELSRRPPISLWKLTRRKINIETYSWGDFNTKWNAGLTTGDLPDMSTAQGTGEVV